MTRYVSTAGLAICLAYLWYHATPHGRYLLAALGAVACVVVIGASAMRGGTAGTAAPWVRLRKIAEEWAGKRR